MVHSILLLTMVSRWLVRESGSGRSYLNEEAEEERALAPDPCPGPRAEPDSHPPLQRAPPVLHGPEQILHKFPKRFSILLLILNHHQDIRNECGDASEKISSAGK